MREPTPIDVHTRPSGPPWGVQPPPRRATLPASTWPFAALGVIAAGMLVAGWGIAGTREQQPAPQPSDIPSVARPYAEPAVDSDDARTQAGVVDTLLADSAASRRKLAPALQQLDACRTLDRAMSVVTTVRDERDRQRRTARTLDTDRLPAGEALKQSLVDVLDHSHRADENYLAWGQALRSRGCTGAHTDVRRWDPESTLARRTEAKSRLVRQWNPIADSFGLTRRASGDI